MECYGGKHRERIALRNKVESELYFEIRRSLRRAARRDRNGPVSYGQIGLNDLLRVRFGERGLDFPEKEEAVQ